MVQQDFNGVYFAHKDKVWRLVSRYAHSKHDREDLFQEVWLRVHQSLAKFRGESEVSTWLYRLTVNTSLSFLKKQSRQQRIRQVLAGLRFIEHDDGPRDEPDTAVMEPLKKLNPRQRIILLMSDVEEKKLEEIGKLLDLPVGTVKSNLFRAREIVRKELEKNDRLQ